MQSYLREVWPVGKAQLLINVITVQLAPRIVHLFIHAHSAVFMVKMLSKLAFKYNIPPTYKCDEKYALLVMITSLKRFYQLPGSCL